MELEKQIAYTNWISIILVIIGLVAIAIGAGYFLSIQTVLGAGCDPVVGPLEEPSTCQEAIQLLNARVSIAIIAGIGAMASGGGIRYYLTTQVP